MRYGLMMLGAGAMALVLSEACLVGVETYPERSVVTSSGAGGGSGGGTSFTTGELGDRCNSDADCVDGLECFTEDPQFGATIAGGMCTTTCTTTTNCPLEGVCIVYGALGYCGLRCQYGGTDPSKKCYGRDDMACQSGFGNEDTLIFCAPRCVRHSQCPSGQFCHPGVGICTTVEQSGDLPGTACSELNDDCRGICVRGICVEQCIVGQDTCPTASWEIACVPDQDNGQVGDAATCLRECCRSGACPGTFRCNRSYGGEGYCAGFDNGPDAPCGAG